MSKRIASIVLAFVVGCNGGGSGTHDGGTDAPRDSAVHDSKIFSDARPDGPPPPALTLKNFDTWCSNTINGGGASTAPVQTANLGAGTYQLTAVAIPDFQLGTLLWHHTDGDTGGGETGTITGSGQTAQSAANVTIVAGVPKCVWVCCESQTETTDCQVPDQCN